MITMITGIPGMGKTSLLIQMLLKELNQGFNTRPIFVMGIPDLKIDHLKCPPIKEWTEKRPDPDDPELMLDYYLFPPKSILIVDECQRVFGARSSGSKVPPIVAALSTHRHTGIDIIVLTQKPLLVDSFLREMVQRHIHIKPTIMGRYLYEWPEFNDVNNKANLSEAAKRKFSPPKEAFQYYKSAEVHTKMPKRFHQVYILLALLFLAIGFFGYKLYNGLYKKVTGQTHAEIVQNEKTDAEKYPIKKTTSNEVKAHSLHDAPTSSPTTPPDIAHPYRGFEFNIKAVIKSARINKTYFNLTNGSKTVFTDSEELIKLGYSINQPNDCAAFLLFNGAQIVATCNTVGDNNARQSGEFAYSQTLKPKVGIESVEPHYTPRPLIDGSDYSASPNSA